MKNDSTTAANTFRSIKDIATYFQEWLIAYLKTRKLPELTKSQIRIFLLLHETPHDHEGWAPCEISPFFEMSLACAQSSLDKLQRLGFVVPSKFQRFANTPATKSWVINPECRWADPELLFGDFAKLS